MPTTLTRTRILDAAEQAFAENGYAGASIRFIAQIAEVDLGAIRYHFGSKDNLFGEVIRRRVEPLCAKRLQRLAALEAEYPDGPLPLERLIKAFLEPALRLLRDEQHGRIWVKLIGHVRVEPGEYLNSVQETYQTLLLRFLHAFHRSLPDLPEEELAYRFYFLFGVEVNTLIDDGTLHAMGRGLLDLHQDPEGVARRLIDFAAAGMSAPLPAWKNSAHVAPENSAHATPGSVPEVAAPSGGNSTRSETKGRPRRPSKTL